MLLFNAINIGAIVSLIVVLAVVTVFQIQYQCINGMSAFGISIGILSGLMGHL